METNTLNDINDNVNINGVNYGESAAPEQQGEEIRTPAPSEQNGETTAQPADVQNMSDKKFDEYINSILQYLMNLCENQYKLKIANLQKQNFKIPF